MSYTVTFVAVCSDLVRFSQLFGKQALLYLNLAWFVPSLPLLVAQAKLDERYDARFGSRAAARFRVVAGEPAGHAMMVVVVVVTLC